MTVTPESGPHVERMQFSFEDRSDEAATLTLSWEQLRLPIRITVDTQAQTLASIRDQLKGLSRFFWQGWNQAANWCLQNEVNLEQAVEWADRFPEASAPPVRRSR